MTCDVEIDHVYCFVEDLDGSALRLEALGFVTSYRREHHGQGTANACFAFENMYLELIAISNAHEASHPDVARLGLIARSRWRTRAACPFGMALRPSASVRDSDSPPEDNDSDVPFATWTYAPSFATASSPGSRFAIANDADDVMQPMMFVARGAIPPSQWPESRQNGLQQRADVARITRVELVLPLGVAPCPALQAIAAHTSLALRLGDGSAPGPTPCATAGATAHDESLASRGAAYACELHLACADGRNAGIPHLPSLAWTAG